MKLKQNKYTLNLKFLIGVALISTVIGNAQLLNTMGNTPIVLKNVKTNSVTNTYSFTHKYVLQIKDGRRTTNIEYYINPRTNYFASRIPEQSQSVAANIMDVNDKKMHILMENGNKKSRMSMRLNIDKVSKHAIDAYTVTITPTNNTKKIIGYTCKEYKIDGDTVEGSVWVTQSAGISFTNAFFRPSSNATDPNWQKLQTGLTLEMDMIDKSKRRPKPIKMTCIALENVSMSYNLSDYKKLL